MSEGDAPREEGFLGRWSRRKRAATTGVAAEAAPPPSAARAEATPPVPAAAPAAPAVAFDLASLPPVESLTAESDIACFLRPQVPAALRSAALRRAWTLDPAIRDHVGPADYAWDFNAPDGMAGFSLELGGEVKRLLAQAIGLAGDEPGPEALPGGATPGGATPDEARPGEALCDAAVPVQALAAPAPEPPPELGAAATPDGPGHPPRAALAAAAASPHPPPPAGPGPSAPAQRRRHGGARPA